jgi:hypothetical protein
LRLCFYDNGDVDRDGDGFGVLIILDKIFSNIRQHLGRNNIEQVSVLTLKFDFDHD